jgi:hypothetical protein
MRTRLLTLALLTTVMLIPTSAGADGLPVLDERLAPFGGSTPPVAGVRYMTIPAAKGTVLAQVDMDTGEVMRSRFIRHRFSVPLVAYDLSAGGLSADGRRLVLIEPRRSYPRADTTFTVIQTRRLSTERTFTLPGDFSFDALSPNGRLLYLVEYLSPRDPTRYLVRLYDLERRRLLPEPIIDPREVGNVMRGMPVTRANSPDGRFAYTLYDGGEHPFIHALDTVARSARCIDLHGLMGFERLRELKLDVSPTGDAIALMLGKEPVAFVDTKTNDVTEPPPAPPVSSTRTVDEDPRSVPWLLLGGLAAALVVLLLLAQRLTRRRPGSAPAELGVELESLLREDNPEPRSKRPRVPVG